MLYYCTTIIEVYGNCIFPVRYRQSRYFFFLSKVVGEHIRLLEVLCRLCGGAGGDKRKGQERRLRQARKLKI